MGARITWTPRDGAISVDLDLDDLTPGIEVIGFVEDSGDRAVSVGRKEKDATISSAYEYLLRLTGIDKTANPTTDDYPFETLSSFLSHADAGGRFSFARDSSKTADTTLATLVNAQSGTTTDNVDVASATGIAAGDWLYLEHLTDKTRWEIMRVKALTTDFDLSAPVTVDYPVGTIVRHWEYWPTCSAHRIDFAERRAGRGADLWDLRMTIRAARG